MQDSYFELRCIFPRPVVENIMRYLYCRHEWNHESLFVQCKLCGGVVASGYKIIDFTMGLAPTSDDDIIHLFGERITISTYGTNHNDLLEYYFGPAKKE